VIQESEKSPNWGIYKIIFDWYIWTQITTDFRICKVKYSLHTSVLQSINILFFQRVFHAAISVSALISRAEAVISEQENFRPFSVKT